MGRKWVLDMGGVRPLWYFHGASTVSSYGFFMAHSECAHGSSWGFHGTFMRTCLSLNSLAWCFKGRLYEYMGVHGASMVRSYGAVVVLSWPLKA